MRNAMTALRRILMVSMVGVSVLLSGCAYTFRSQVTTFHQWTPATQAKTYIVERDAEQNNNPEYKTYEELLRKRLALSGFSEAKTGDSADFKVNFKFSTSISMFNMPLAYYPYLVDSFGRIHARSAWFYSRNYLPVGYIDPFGRQFAFPMNSTYSHGIEIEMVKISNGEKLAQVKVSSEQLNPSIALYMEDLLESAFVEFPGPSGQVRQVELKPPPKQ